MSNQVIILKITPISLFYTSYDPELNSFIIRIYSPVYCLHESNLYAITDNVTVCIFNSLYNIGKCHLCKISIEGKHYDFILTHFNWIKHIIKERRKVRLASILKI